MVVAIAVTIRICSVVTVIAPVVATTVVVIPTSVAYGDRARGEHGYSHTSADRLGSHPLRSHLPPDWLSAAIRAFISASKGARISEVIPSWLRIERSCFHRCSTAKPVGSVCSHARA